MGYSIDIDTENFTTEVLEKSYVKPVIADFYATWCGPCQLLKPTLEKLVKEYDFILAKIDIDRSPELAKQYGVQGVPDVRVIQQGEISPGFVGALSEPQLKKFLEQLNLKSDLDWEIEKVKKVVASKDYQQAKLIFDQLFGRYPDENKLVIEAALFLIKVKQLESADQILKTIPEDDREYHPKAQAIRTLIEFKGNAETATGNVLDEAFLLAARSSLSDQPEEALQLFLGIVQQNRKYRTDAARKAMIALFNVLGLEHPLTRKYQQELMMTLY